MISREIGDKVKRSGVWWWLVVGLSGGMGIDDAGSGHQASLFQRLPFLIAQQSGLLDIRMNEGRPCLQMWRGVLVSFSLISISQI